MAKEKDGAQTEREKAVELAIKQIRKDFGDGSIMKLGENTHMQI